MRDRERSNVAGGLVNILSLVQKHPIGSATFWVLLLCQVYASKTLFPCTFGIPEGSLDMLG